MSKVQVTLPVSYNTAGQVEKTETLTFSVDAASAELERLLNEKYSRYDELREYVRQHNERWESVDPGRGDRGNPAGAQRAGNSALHARSGSSPEAREAPTGTA